MNNQKSLFTLRRGSNLRRKVFAEEFAIDGDGTRAAIAAGYSTNGAAAAASRLLDIPVVQETIQEIRETAAVQIGLRMRDNLETVRAKAIVSLAEYVAFDNGAIRWKRLDELSTYQVSALDHVCLDDSGETMALKFSNLHEALLELGELAMLPGFSRNENKAA